MSEEIKKEKEKEKILSQRSKLSTADSSTNQTLNALNDYYISKFKSYSCNDSINLPSIKKILQKDLLDYQSYTKLTITKVQNSLSEIIHLLQDAVNIISNNYEIKLYGSRATNLCLSWSDIDVVIISKVKKNEKVNVIAFLDKLYQVLNKEKWVSSIKYISKTKIPIIKVNANEKYNYIKIDISFDDYNHFGLKCVDLVKDYIDKYEALEPIVLAVKTMLKLSALNDPYTGGINSYGVILMIIAYLKKEIAKGKEITVNYIGDIMIDFLYYYGCKPNTNYVNVNNIEEYNYNASLNPFELFIIDPLNKENNVGKSTFQYINLKSMFLIALQSLKEECYCGCHYNLRYSEKDDSNVHSSSNSNSHIEHNILKKMFNAVKRTIS